MAGAVLSTLYQRVKFVVGESLIIVVAGEDMVATTTVNIPYVEPNKDAMECSFRSLEIAFATYTGKSSKIPTSRLSKTTWMGVRQALGKGAKAGQGLGKKLQGKKWAITVVPLWVRI